MVHRFRYWDLRPLTFNTEVQLMKIPACNVPPCVEQPSCTAQQDLCSPQATIYIKGEAGQNMLTGAAGTYRPRTSKTSALLYGISSFGANIKLWLYSYIWDLPPHATSEVTRSFHGLQ